MRESAIEAKLSKEVKRRGGYTRKWTSPSNRGVPDRIVIWPNGTVHFVELKTDTGRLTKLQTHEHRQIEKVGGVVFTLYGWSDCQAYIDEFSGSPTHVES